MYQYLLYLLILISADDAGLAPPDVARNPNWVQGIVPASLFDMFTPMEYQADHGPYQGESFHYRLFQPRKLTPELEYPLLIWASGYGEKGDDNFAQLRHLHYVFQDPQTGEHADFFCLVMQVPDRYGEWVDAERTSGDLADVLMLLSKDVQDRFPVDPDRIYLSGVSSGGSVCWELVQRYPEAFAAVAPIASGGGGTNRERLASIAKVPIWAFHCSRDPLTPIGNVQQTVRTLSDLGGNVYLTIVDSDYHDSWTSAFQEHRLMDWFLMQRRGQRCWWPPGWIPFRIQELAFFVGVPLVLVVAVVSEKKRRRKQAAAKANLPTTALLLPLLGLLTLATGCDPPPPGRAQPYGAKLYIRSDSIMAEEKDAKDKDSEDLTDGWGICDERNLLEYKDGDRYEAVLTLTSGVHQFKIADSTWHGINLGGWPNASRMDLGTPYGLLLSEGASDLSIEVPASSDYRFTLHASNRHKPLLVIVPAEESE